MKKGILFVVLSIYAVIGWTQETQVSAPLPSIIGDRHEVKSWHNGLDTAGEVDVMNRYEVGLKKEGSDRYEVVHVVELGNKAFKSGLNLRAKITEIFKESNPGKYEISLRMIDRAENKSDWSEAIIVLYDKNKPTAPGAAVIIIGQ